MSPPLSNRLGLKRLSELGRAQRRQLWAWIQQHDPDRAAEIERQKPLLELCRKELDPNATVVLPRDYVQRALRGACSE